MKIYRTLADINADRGLSPTQREVISETMRNTGAAIDWDGKSARVHKDAGKIRWATQSEETAIARLDAPVDYVDGVIVEEVPPSIVVARSARGHAIPDWAIEEAYYPARTSQRRERALQAAKNMPPWEVRKFLARHGIKAKK